MSPGCTRDKGLVIMTVVKACRSTRVALTFCVGIFAILAACRKTSQPEATLPVAKTTVQTVKTPHESNPGGEDCGLSAYPASKSNRQIVADAPHVGKRPPNSAMLAKVEIDKDGRVTHLRVLRLAYPEAPNSESINEQAVDSLKRRHYAPTMIDGTPVVVCSDVSVTIDLGSD